MATSYTVSIGDTISKRVRATTTTWYVRWRVEKQKFNEPFKHDGLAKSFWAELRTAANRGEGFDTETGLPASMSRPSGVTWYQAACRYVDGRWPADPGLTRRTIAHGLMVVGVVLLPQGRGRPHEPLLRHALRMWAFRADKRTDPAMPPDVKAALRWVERHSPPISVLNSGGAQRVLDQLSVRMDGKPGLLAPNSVKTRFITFRGFVSWCLRPEQRLLREDPLADLASPIDQGSPLRPIDRRTVPNPLQARTLLHAIRDHSRAGRRLFAYFSCIWLAGMRPSEAAGLTVGQLDLPKEGWGDFYLSAPAPHAGKDWTDSGADRDDPGRLKHRRRGVVRPVPCSPELTAIVHAYIGEFGVGPGGRLFSGENGEAVSYRYSLELWHLIRGEVFTPETAATGLAATPYHLRHAWVSTMLAARVEPVEIAQDAGHSLTVLLAVYAQIIDGGKEQRRRRQERAFGYADARTPGAPNQRGPSGVGGGRRWEPIRLGRWSGALSAQVRTKKRAKGERR